MLDSEDDWQFAKFASTILADPRLPVAPHLENSFYQRLEDIGVVFNSSTIKPQDEAIRGGTQEERYVAPEIASSDTSLVFQFLEQVQSLKDRTAIALNEAATPIE
jgi:hypothetical protein